MELWEQYRDQFPVTKNLIYLNHAAVAPLCLRSAEAMQHLAQDALDFGSLHYDRWIATYEGVRTAAARLLNATPEEIAIVKNTSEGIATAAMGIDWQPGDIVVAFTDSPPIFTPGSASKRRASRFAGCPCLTTSTESTTPAAARACWRSALCNT